MTTAKINMNNSLKNIFILIVIIAAIAGFFWIANFLGSGEKAQSEKPLVICQPQSAPPEQPSAAFPSREATDEQSKAMAGKQKCYWTAHIHAMVRVFKDGKEIPIKFEEGKLEGQHTHSEPNKLHWHGLIPVDAKTPKESLRDPTGQAKEVIDWSALEVQKIITDFGRSQEGTPKFIVNGKEVEPSYIWKDGDNIEIRYE